MTRLRILFLLVAVILTQTTVGADEKTIQGSVKPEGKLAKSLPEGGTLFVFARDASVEAGPPVAVLKIDNPKFPQKYALGPGNVMIPGTEFKGPFRVTARYSPSGDAMQKKGAFQGETKSPVKAGAKNADILLDKKL